MPPGPLTTTLSFEKKNQNLQKLPKHAKIQKRPIPHTPTPSPHAGPQAPKTVYISTKTPFMSAVKRVQKMLRLAEKRAMSSSSARVEASLSRPGTTSTSNSKGSGGGGEKVVHEREKLSRIAVDMGTEGEDGGEGGDGKRRGRKNEEVFVKATGRAMEKALSVGRWFEGADGDGGKGGGEYSVRVNTGSVLVVDDVVEDESEKGRLLEELEGEKNAEKEQQEQQQPPPPPQQPQPQQNTGDDTSLISTPPTQPPPPKQPGKSNRKRKRSAISADEELPETRTRWVNMVEVAISLK